MFNRTLVIACLMHAIIIGAGYMTLPPLALEIAREGWPLAAVERAWVLIPLGSVPAAFLTVKLSKAMTEVGLLRFSSTIAAIAFLARALPIGYTGYAIALLIYGAATGIMLTLMTIHVSRSVGDHRSGIAQAIFFSAYAVGVAASLGMTEPLLSAFGNWRPIQLFWGVCSVLLAFLARRFYPIPADNRDLRMEARIPLEIRRYAVRYAVTYGCYTAAYLSLSNALPTHLRLSGWLATNADLSLASSTLAFLIGSAVWASATDRFGYRGHAFGVAMCGAAFSVLLIWRFAATVEPTWASGAILLTGLFTGAAPLFFLLC
jgi:MFS family permease